MRAEAFFEIKLDASSLAIASSDIGQRGSYKATVLNTAINAIVGAEACCGLSGDQTAEGTVSSRGRPQKLFHRAEAAEILGV